MINDGYVTSIDSTWVTFPSVVNSHANSFCFAERKF